MLKGERVLDGYVLRGVNPKKDGLYSYVRDIIKEKEGISFRYTELLIEAAVFRKETLMHPELLNRINSGELKVYSGCRTINIEVSESEIINL